MLQDNKNRRSLARISWIGCLLLAVASVVPAWALDSGCAELADPRDAGLPGPPAGQPQVTCAGFFPFAVTTDGSETTRVEVRIQSDSVTAASLGNTFPIVGVSVDGANIAQTGAFIDLFDDGSHGDRVSGDRIWSRSGFRVDATPIPPILFYDFDRLRYTDESGAGEISIWASGNGQYGPAKLGRLDPSKRVTVVSIGDGFYTTDNVVFIVDEAIHAELRWLLRASAPVANIKSVTQRFYERFPDVFDFILLMPGAHVPGGLRGASLFGSNAVSGIGRALSDDSASWGSSGRLQNVFPLNLSEGGPVLHEISHRWGISVGADLGIQQCAPAHVGIAGVGCGPLGGFDAESLVDNLDGTWSVSNDCFSQGGAGVDTTAMNPLNLYLAGLIPASEVPPFPVPVNADCTSVRQDFATKTATFTADGMATRTIEEIIELHGPRVPDYTTSQRAFNLAWVVPINRMPNPTEAGWFQYRAEYIGRTSPGDQPFRLTFRDATGGRATLTTHLGTLTEVIFKNSFENP